ncbi:uncharacterized protein [Miscanthus floridulus]|uniref:uncharacterized protein n=1 Tax=Miscanthus floridulus TaxID=154761 RepID=UPI00345A089E
MVEQVAAEVTQPPPQRTDGAPGLFFLSRKRPVDELPLAPLKELKASPGSSAHWVAEAQATIQRGTASTRADPKEPAAQGRDAEATPTQTGEGVLPPHEGEAHESDGAGVPLVAEAPGVSEAEATEAGAPKTAETAAAGVGVSATTEATMVEAGALETIEAMTAEARAPKITEADVMVARPSAQEAEMKAVEALVAPLVQGPPLLQESAREVEELETRSLGKLVFSGGRGTSRTSSNESEAEVIRAAKASSAVQTVLETKIGEHEALKHAALSACEALEVEGVQDGYVLPNDDEEVDAAVMKLMEAAEGPGTALATLFEEEVVPPLPSVDAGGSKP